MGSHYKWGYKSPLIWVIVAATLHITLLITTHESPSIVPQYEPCQIAQLYLRSPMILDTQALKLLPCRLQRLGFRASLKERQT